MYSYSVGDVNHFSKLCAKVGQNLDCNLSSKTTLDVREKWSFLEGGCFRQVQSAWNLMVDRNFHKLKNDLSREGGIHFQRGSFQIGFTVF